MYQRGEVDPVVAMQLLGATAGSAVGNGSASKKRSLDESKPPADASVEGGGGEDIDELLAQAKKAKMDT